MHSIRKGIGMLFLIMVASMLTACEPFWSDIRALRSGGYVDDGIHGGMPLLGGGRVVVQEAYIESVEVTILDTFPTRVSITAYGSLPDRCTEIRRIAQAMSGNTILISIYTTHPVDALCVEQPAPFVERLLLNLTGLEPGLYAVSVNGVTAPLHLTEEMLTLHEHEHVCPPPRPGLLLFRSDEDGYCVLVPDTFRARRPAPGVTSFSGPKRGSQIDPLRAGLTIQQLGAVSERPPDEIAREHLREYIAGGAALQWSTITLGGIEAVVVDGVPGHGMVRQVFFVHRGVLYMMALAPTDPEQGMVAEDAAALWQAVVSSFTFTVP